MSSHLSLSQSRENKSKYIYYYKWFIGSWKKKKQNHQQIRRNTYYGKTIIMQYARSALGKRESKEYDLQTDFCRNSANGITFYRGQWSSSGLWYSKRWRHNLRRQTPKMFGFNKKSQQFFSDRIIFCRQLFNFHGPNLKKKYLYSINYKSLNIFLKMLKESVVVS